MKTFFAATLAASALAFNGPEIVSDANGYAQLNIKEDGKDKTVYIASPSWFTGGGGDTLSLPEGGRVYLSNTPELSSEGFYKPALLGGAVEYDVDMSQMECGCIAAFYLVRMPAHDWSGNLDKTDGFWYCDANQVDGEYCPEFDIMEANKYAYQTTTHSCNAPSSGGHYDYCNRGGTCVTNTVEKWNHQGQNHYGPGGQYTIDTTQEFHVKIEFKADSSNQFESFQTTLTQNGKTASLGCDDGSNHGMTGDLSEMSFAISSWSGDATWLWKDSCGGSCGNPTLAYKNISITTGGSTPVPPIHDYTYGDACASKSDDYCDGSCDCRWSWPTNDPLTWKSKDAACRCKA